MLTTETPFTHQVRLIRCQALSAELASLRAKLATTRRGGDDADLAQVNILLRGIDELEKALAEAAGSSEQRALEAAQHEVEGQLAQALLDDATRQTPQSIAGVKRLQDKLRALSSAPPKSWDGSIYTSEAEEKLAQARFMSERIDLGKEDWHRRLADLRGFLGAS
jgi:HPt (histidine-containing phosphotransfer) domain-containing protein